MAASSLLAGCDLIVDNTLKGTFGTAGFFTVSADDDFIELKEGGSAHIILLLDAPSPEVVEAQWEILGGAGEFDLHQGTLEIKEGKQSVSLPAIEVLKDLVLEGEQRYQLVISSPRFKNKGKKLEVVLKVEDTTQPAKLRFEPRDELVLPAALVETTSERALTIYNDGEAEARQLQLQVVGGGGLAPFRYKGGSYPGEGGTCGATLLGGASCQVVFEFAPGEDVGSFERELRLTYLNYVQPETVPDPSDAADPAHYLIKAVSADVVAEIISGKPADPSNTHSLDLEIGGKDITEYRYKVVPGKSASCSSQVGYSAPLDIDSHIIETVSAPDGWVTLCVVGHNGTLWQPFESATYHTWTKDTEAPELNSFVINAGATYTTSPVVGLTVSEGATREGELVEMLISNSATCPASPAEEDWRGFASAVSDWDLSDTPQGQRFVSIKLRDGAGNQTLCLNDDIFLDTLEPQAPPNVLIGATPFSLSETPQLSYDAALDPGAPATGSGTAKHEARLYNKTTDTYLTDWAAHTSGSPVSFVGNLVEGDEYHLEVRGVDTAGNLGEIAISDSWLASGPVKATIAGAPTGTNNVTDLDVQVGGGSITAYRYKVGTDALDCEDGDGYQPPEPGQTVSANVEDTISHLPDGPIKICVIGTNGILWQPLEDPTFAIWVKDTEPPQDPEILINAGAAYTSDHEVGLTLSAADAHEMYVTNTENCADADIQWVDYAASIGTWELAQTNAEDIAVYAMFRDEVGNATHCVSAVITHDNLNPDDPSGFVLGSVPPSLNNSPAIDFTAAEDNGPAGILEYEIQILKVAGDLVVEDWQVFEAGESVAGLDLEDGESYYAKIRARDRAGNISAGADTPAWVVAGDLLAKITGAPSSLSQETVLDVTVSGTNITQYRYKVTEGDETNCASSADYLPASPGADVSTKIEDDFSGLSDGSITLCVVGSNGTDWQAFADATYVSWVKDVTAPTGINLVINNGDAFTGNDEVTLSLSATDAHAIEMYVTNTDGCVADGSWDAFAPSMGWTLGQTNETATVYVAFRDALGNTSGCISGSILHDDTRPNDPTNLLLGFVPPSTSTTPLIHFYDATDPGAEPSGVAGHQVQIHSASDDSVVEAWQDFSSGDSVTGLSLTDGGEYYAKVRAVDNAGNASEGANTLAWTVAGALIAEISGEPESPSNTTELDVTIGGTNITHYRYKLVEGGSTGCTDPANYIPSEPGTPVGDKITDDFSALADGSITLCVIGSNGADWQEVAEATSVSWVKDTAVPHNISIAINDHEPYTSDDEVVLTLSAEDDHAVEMYVTNSAGCTAGGSWESFSTSKVWTLGQTNEIATVYVSFKDSLGNTTSCISDDVHHDSVEPGPPTDLALGSVPPSVSRTPVITFTDAEDPGAAPSGVERHEIQILTSGDTVVKSWQPLSSGEALSDLTLINGSSYYAQLRSIDHAGNISEVVATEVWTVSGQLVAVINNPPADPSRDTVLDVTISGTNITQYRYKIIEGDETDCASSADYLPAEPGRDVATKIEDDFSALPDGSITLCVIGSNGSEWQDLLDASSASWIKDTTPPQNLALVINMDEAYTTETEVQLSLSADEAYEMYITNDAGCATGGAWEAFATAKDWDLAGENQNNTVYVAFRDELENTTSCISDSIIHDNQKPNAPSDLVLAATPPSLNRSPGISYTDNGDVGPAGIDRFEVQIHLASDDSVVEAWQPHVSGDQVTGLSLEDGQQYYARLRAADRAGHLSDEVSTATWTVAGALLAKINNPPESPSKDTVLDVTISGTNITNYRYKIGETSGITCSDSSGYVPASPGTPVGTKITQDFTGLPDGSITLCVVGSNGTDWQAFSDATERTWVKDTTAPTDINLVINNGDAFTRNDEVTLTLSGSDAHAIEMYVTNTAGCTAGGTWDAFASSMSWTLGQTNETATVYVAFRDAVGNTSSCISDTILHDATDPGEPTNLQLGSVPPSLSITPVITFTDATDPGSEPSGVAKHQVQIHSASDDSVVKAWQDFISGTSVTGLSLTDGEQYYAKVRAIDNAGNMSDGVDTASWTVAGALIAIINDAPEDPSKDTSLDVTISGTNVTHYRYKIGESSGITCSDSSGYMPASPGTAVGTKISQDFSALSDGSITLCVVGSNGTDWQALADATYVSWVKDTTAPTGISIAINDDDDYTADKAVTLTLAATDSLAIEMYITNTADCGGTESWEAFSASKNWALAQEDQTATVYARFRDALGNTTSCISDTILHDATNPGEPTNLQLGSVPPSLSETPVITFTDAEDPGSEPSGVAKHQVQIHLASDDSVVEGWQDFVSGNSVTGLSLTDGEQYYAKVRAIDNAGNMSEGVDTASWTVAGALIAIINDAPEDPSKDTSLDVTISGTNVTHYRYKVGETSGTTCSDSSGYAPASPGAAVGTKITHDFSALSDGSITLCVVGSNGSQWQDFTDATYVTWVKDTTAPTGLSVVINNDDDYTASTASTLTLAATDAQTPIEMYITNTAGCTQDGTWETFSTSRPWALGQTNGTATVYAAFRDSLGNTSTCQSDDIVHDNSSPNNPSGLTLGSIPPSLGTTPSITFTDEGDNGPAGVEKFEIQIHAADNSVVTTWQDFVSGNAVSGLTLADGQQYYAKIRAVDRAGNRSEGTDTPLWTVAGALMATITGEPNDPSNVTDLDVTIGGTNITHFRHKLVQGGNASCTDSTGYSALPGLAVGTNITDSFSGLDDGEVTLCVIGGNGSEWQDFGTPTYATWVKDTTAPTGISIAINSDDDYTADTAVTLTLAATDSQAIEMYVTNSADCGGTESWEAFSTSKNWVLAQEDQTATVYARFRDALGNTTSCISDTILHDATNPGEPTNLQLGSVPPSLSETPVITFTDAEDPGSEPSGVAKHQVQIHLASDDSVVEGWQDFVSGNSVTGLSLTDGEQYYAKVRAIDNAGNMSDGVDTATWTVAGALMAVISGEPDSPSNATVLDVTISGTNVTHYRYKVGETSGTTCSDSGGYAPASPGTAVGTKITQDFSAFSDGSITLCVVGSNGSQWQDFTDATYVTWVKDTTAPNGISIAINSDDEYTSDKNVTLTLAATDSQAIEMYVTNSAGCGGTESWEAFSTSKNWVLAQEDQTARVYARFRDALGNTTSCISDTILHDATNPGEPTNLQLGSVPPSLSETPVITFTDAEDPGSEPSGVAKHQVQIHLASDDSVVEGWQDFASGSSVTGLSLTDGEQYYAKVRAIDNAGNMSDGVDTPAWEVSGSLLAIINNGPLSPSDDTVLDITISGTNVTEYRYKIGEAGTVSCEVESGYSAATPIGTKISHDFSMLPNGPVTLCVVGSNGAVWQPFGDATKYTWEKASPMILVVNTALSAGEQVSLPLNGTVNALVRWGDGESDSFSSAEVRSHTYGSAGSYTIKIFGTVTQFGNGSSPYPNADKIVRVESFGDIGITSFEGAFRDAINLVAVPNSLPSGVTTLRDMFYGAKAFNADIGSWDISDVTEMRSMFRDAESFNQNIGSWNTSKVTNMSHLFSGASSFNQNIGAWQTGQVGDMGYMFNGAEDFDQDISSWSTVNVVSMADMFRGAISFNQDISSWKTENVTNMSDMFNGASAFHQEIGGWETSSVTDMHSMFRDASLFNGDISGWKTSSVTNMDNMFHGATVFNQDLSSWCVSQFSTKPSGFDTGASAWTRPKPNWGSCALPFDENNMILLVDTSKGSGRTVSLPLMGTVSNLYVDWGDGNVSGPLNSAGVISHPYSTDGLFTVTIYGDTLTQFGNGSGTFSNPEKILAVVSFGDLGLTSLSGAFRNAVNLTSVPSTIPSSITHLDHTFRGATSFNDPSVGSWNVSNVTHTRFMFSGASVFDQDLSGWVTSSIRYMDAMFDDALAFNQNISGWDTSDVRSMNSMFRGAQVFDQPIGIWKTGKVANMATMFDGALAFNQPLDDWDVSKVEHFSGMFTQTELFNQPLSSWDVTSALSMDYMFSEALSFNQDLSSWCVSQFPSRPEGFSTSANEWVLPEPRWGECPGSKTPSSPEILISGGADYTVSQNVTLTLSVTDALEMYITNTAGCGSGGTWEPLNATRSWSLASSNAENTVYAKFRHGGNESACVSASITHDNQNPKAPTDILLSLAPVGLNQSPTISYTAAVDQGPAGIESHQVRIVRFSGGVEVKGWASHNSGNSVSSLTLEHGVTYRAEIRGVDHAGNIGAVALSDPWTAYESLEAVLAGEPSDPSEDTALDVTVGGVGVAVYRYKVGPTGATNCGTGSGYSSEVPVTTKITDDLSTLGYGSLTLCVRGGNGTDWQPLAQATEFTWLRSDPMILVVDTRVSTGSEVSLPLYGTVSNVYVDWGDGERSGPINSDGLQSHTYTTDGEYTVKVYGGTLTQFGDGGHLNPTSPPGYTNADKIISLQSFGALGLTSLRGAFHGAVNLTSVPAALPPEVVDLASMFQGATSFNQNINSWNTENVLDMQYMFAYASSFNQPLNNWDMSKLRSAIFVGYRDGVQYMFLNATSFNSSVSGWNFAHVLSLQGLFQGATNFNQPVNDWNVSNVEEFFAVFMGARSFNQPLNNWDTSKADTFQNLFNNARAFNQNINNWNTSRVESLVNTFKEAHNFNQPLNNWDVSKVTEMGNLFYEAKVFNQDLSSWKTGNVTRMGQAFFRTDQFNGDITGWNTSSVTTMEKMFYSAGEGIFTQDISGWDVSGVVNMEGMFHGQESFDRDLSSWCVSQIESEPPLFDQGAYAWTAPRPNWGSCPPANPFLAINDGQSHTETTHVLLTLSATDADEMYITNTAGCSGGGTWEPYATEKDWVLEHTDALNTVYVQYRSSSGTGACVSASITHKLPSLFRAVSMGETFGCAINQDGDAYCWGDNSHGQLGDGTGVGKTQPVKVLMDTESNDHKFVDIAAGGQHACGVTGSGSVYCWGNNGQGRLGDNTTVSRDAPVRVDVSHLSGNQRHFTSVVAGSTHTCALTVENQAYCWGANDHGQLGKGAAGGELRPSAVDTSQIPTTAKRFQQLTAGWAKTCGVTTEGIGYCWGEGAAGALGTGTTSSLNRPSTGFNMTEVAGGNDARWRVLRLGGNSTCGVTATDGRGYCWGRNYYGLLGDNSWDDRQRPRPINTGSLGGVTTWLDIQPGREHTCGITSQGRMACWGAKSLGTLGVNDGSGGQELRPVYVDTALLDGSTTFQELAVNLRPDGSEIAGSTCGLANGRLYCWGRNDLGQLADATTEHRFRPAPTNTTLVPHTGDVFKEVFYGATHMCGLTHDGRALCWGSGSGGKLGQGSSGSSATAVEVDTGGMVGEKTFRKLALAGDSSCGVATDGIPYCWGRNNLRQLGTGNTTGAQRPTPVSLTNIVGVQDVIDIAAGNNGGCLVTAEGLTYCWGQNEDGEVGVGTSGDPKSRPVPVVTGSMSPSSGPLTRMKQISGGSYHNCGVTVAGVTHCWGYAAETNNNLGVGDTNGRTRPTPVLMDNVTGEKVMLEVFSSHNFSCGRASDSEHYCWGNSGSGKHGSDKWGAVVVPTQVNKPGGVKFKTWHPVGTDNACGITATGRLYCAGRNAVYGLGRTTPSNHSETPVEVTYTNLNDEADSSALMITKGRSHHGDDGSHSICSVLASGKMYCWGQNNLNQSGPGPGLKQIPTIFTGL